MPIRETSDRMQAPADETLLTTCPRDCYDGCGILVRKRAGRIVSVRGDPAHPVSRGRLCGKCATAYNREWIDPRARLLQPARRAGVKGTGVGETVSWEAAIGEIAARLARIESASGARSILNVHYTGTTSLIAGAFPMRFFHRLGATEVAPDTICNMAGHVALKYLYGTSTDGFDPRTADRASCILIWGANPHASAPHAHAHWLRETDAALVVVDPIRTPTAARADLHLQPFPGSDAVLAYALMHALWRRGAIDHDFLARHALGWEEIEPIVTACDPLSAAEITGVPAAAVEEAARLYARGPSLLWLGQGLQRQPSGGNVMRACALLPAVTGNLGRPGCGLLYLNGNLERRGIDPQYLSAPGLARPGAPRAISHMDLAAVLEDARRARGLIVWNMNPLASCPQQARLRRALAREDLFTVAIDLFATDTTAYADYVLPAASFLEFDDLLASYFHYSLSAQVKAADPPGEALTNQEIFRRLARAMGYAETELYESDAAIIERLLAGAGDSGGFASLAAQGTRWVAPDPVIPFADLRFPTPSGRIEIASSAAAADGLPRTAQCRADPRPAAGRLRLLSPAHAWLLNTSFGNVARIEARLGEATIALHPADAGSRGLRAGDRVSVSNEFGALLLKVAHSADLPRGVALAHKGRWLEAGGNVNALNGGAKSDMGESTSVHGVEVTVAPALCSATDIS